MLCPECHNENPRSVLFCERCGFYFGGSVKKDEKKFLKDRYKIVSYLSSGDSGRLLLAYDARLSKACAVKEIRKKGLLKLSPEEREAIINPFKREAELLAFLRHSNLPCIVDYFIEGELFYLVMDYIEGKDLEGVLRASPGGVIEEKQVIEWAIQICRVLEYLHSQKPPIIHGDLKPSNLILRDSDGILVLVDFGISSLLDILEVERSNVEAMDGYIPPEQYTKKPVMESDIYSLGVSLYEFLSGNLPSELFNFIPLREIRPEISPEIEFIIMKCVEYEIENRYKNISILKQSLLEVYSKNFVTDDSKYKTNTIIDKSNTETAGQSQKIKVFMVDDDTDMCNSFEEISRYFHDINLTGVAHNGKEAIEILSAEEEKPDIVLMDVKMPVMNGIEATKEIRKILPSAKIVILSAYLEETEFWECFKAGATGYILKGSTFWEDLEKAIKNAFGGGTPVSPAASTLMVKALSPASISSDKILLTSLSGMEDEKDSTEDEDEYDGEEMIECPSCNKLNNIEANYCRKCGLDLQEYDGEDYEEEIIEEILVDNEDDLDEDEVEVIEEIIMEEVGDEIEE